MGVSLGRHRAIATIITGISQALTLFGVALLGVLIAAKFGSNAATDGFFFANSVYAIVLFVGQSLRTTSVAALVEDPKRNGPDLAAAIGWFTLLAGALFALLAVLVVPRATGDLPPEAESTANETLLILWPAAGMQMLGGLTAALLATRERYALAANAYAVGSFAAVIGFVLFTPSAGVDGVPLALLLGVSVTFTILVVGAARRGGLPLGRPRLGGSLFRARQLLLGSAALVAAQFVVTSSVAFAASVGEGSATTYSYAVMAVSSLLAGAVTPVSVVFAPVVARSWDRTRASLAGSSVRAYRAGALFTAPLIAGLLLLGPEPAAHLLTALDQETLDEVFTLALILSPALLTTLTATIPQLGILAQQRFAELAAMSLGVVVVHVALSAGVVAAGGGLNALAAVASCTSVLLVAGVLALAFGRDAWGVAWRMVIATVQIVVPGVIAFAAAAWLLQPDGDFLPGLAAWLIGMAASSVWLWVRRADELRALAAAVRRTES
ncbi:MAG: hypothetical protein JHC95_07340 [Solirubrobacteraceae bacterium]|nr:hypothetical protein [Solirubrobacteraceae bacterium]